MKNVKFLLSVLIFLIMAACAQTIYQPPEIYVPSNTSKKDVRQKIVNALHRRGWRIEKDWNGFIQASYQRRIHVARVGVHYGKDKVQINYIDSENLKFRVKDGSRTIHRRYNGWVRNLEKDIARGLGSSRVSVTRGSSESYSKSSSKKSYSKGSSSTSSSSIVTGGNQGAIVDDNQNDQMY